MVYLLFKNYYDCVKILFSVIKNIFYIKNKIQWYIIPKKKQKYIL